MNRAHSAPLLCTLLALGCASTWAEPFRLRLDRESGIYSTGDVIRLSGRAEDAPTSTLFRVSALRDAVHPLHQTTQALGTAWQELCAVTADRPACISFSAEPTDRPTQGQSLGAVAGLDAIAPMGREPADLDDFWRAQKDRLAARPANPVLTPVSGNETSLVCFDLELACVEPRPARGYFARPRKAAPGSLPAVIFLHAAGVDGHWCKARPETALRFAARGQGALALDLNAHGMLNGQPDAYYTGLATGELKEYIKQGHTSRDTWYFLGMYLRLLRAIEFLCAQPEWDGQRLLLTGESQGGGQALAGAGLDPRVSHVVAIVPALGDLGAAPLGRKGGWPNIAGWALPDAEREQHLAAAAYFDTAFLSARSRARTHLEAGLVDTVCPPASVIAVHHALRGEKTLYLTPYRGHQEVSDHRREAWVREVLSAREQFVRNFFRE